MTEDQSTTSTQVFVAADHAGIALKQILSEHLANHGYAVCDLGPKSTQSVDYPDFAHLLAGKVSTNVGSRGLLVCGTGVGMAMSANRWPAIRAVNCTDLLTVRMARAHNNANVLCLGARVIGEGLATELLDTFLATAFDDGRHRRRVAKIERSDDEGSAPALS